MTYSHVLLGINNNGKKGMGGQRVTLSLAQPRWRRPRTCKKDQFHHLGCVYPAHGSASNMTVSWLLAGKVLILTTSFINKQLLSITCC